MPKLNPNWRWEDEEQALLTSCSSLIAIVESDGSRIVQFSHFSVKEFLTSDRLATPNGDISRYHIDSKPAHTVLAQARLSVLLRLDDRVEESDIINSSPLARYAAEHWVIHSRDEIVSSRLRRPMEYLLDADKPYFAAWLQLHDIDTATPSRSAFHPFTPISKSNATPLYYAALCGFRDLVEHFIANNPGQVNATGGYYLTPLVAALAAGHLRTAKFLHDNGADPNVTGYRGMTPLQSTVLYGGFEMIQLLLEFNADVDTRDVEGKTPLHFASQDHYLGGPITASSLSNVARLLLEHGAYVNARDNDGFTPLHVATIYRRIEVVRVLLEHGADVGARENHGKTALHIASNDHEIRELLSEHVR